MFSHVMIGTNDLEKAKAELERAMAAASHQSTEEES